MYFVVVLNLIIFSDIQLLWAEISLYFLTELGFEP